MTTLVTKFVDLKLGTIGSASDAIRVAGVYVCVLRGSPRRCRCLKPLVKSQGPNLLRQTLRQALPRISTST